ncbi:hypothetical protein PAEPH01_0975 [Pancytospora epiphaga]|nr:hypothetical protein PAEPH01_0975 [Pancytospora epiphaga]
MVLVLKLIKEPDAVYDVKTIKYEERQCFVASFGMEVRLFSYDGDEIITIPVPRFVYRVVPYKNNLFFLCSYCYYCYLNGQLGLSCSYGRPLERIKNVLQLGRILMITCESGYISAKIVGDRLVFGEYPNDSTFYKVISGSSMGRYIHDPGEGPLASMLCKSMSRRVLLHYTIKDGSLFQISSEVVKYGFIFCHKGVLYGVDEEGIREAREGAPLLREIGNDAISYVFSDEEKGRMLLFCQNGEVIQITEGSFETKTVLQAYGPVNAVAKIDGVYFIGSEYGSHFITDEYKSLRVIDCFGDVRKAFYLDDVPAYFTGRNMVKIEMLVPLYRLGSLRNSKDNIWHNSIRGCVNLPCVDCKNSICLRSMFKTTTSTIITYNRLSIINGAVSDVILTAGEIGETTVFTTSSALYILYDDSIKRITVNSSIVKYKENFVFIYHYDRFYTIDIVKLEALVFTVPVSVYDILIENGVVYLVHIGAVLEPLNMADGSPYSFQIDLISKDSLYSGEMGEAERLCTEHAMIIEYHRSFIEGYPYKLITGNTSLTSSGGSVYRLVDSVLCPLFSSYSHILKVAEYDNGLLVQTSEGTYHHDLESKETVKFNINATPFVSQTRVTSRSSSTFISKKSSIFNTSSSSSRKDGSATESIKKLEDEAYLPGLFLLCNNQVVGARSFVPFYMHSVYRVHDKNRGHLVYNDSFSTVKIYQTGPAPSFLVVLNGNNHLIYKNQAFVDSAVVDSNLLAIVACDELFLNNSLILISIKGSRLIIKYSVVLDSVPLAVTSRGKTIAVVTIDGVGVFAMKGGSVKLIEYIEGSFRFTYNVVFVSDSTLLIQNKDWSYDVVEISKGAVKHRVTEGTSTPFIFSGVEGFLCGNKLNYAGIVSLYLGEEVAAVFSLNECLLVVTCSGAFLLVYDTDMYEYTQESPNKLLDSPCVRRISF